MTAPAERMKAMRDRRRKLGPREVRMVLPDSRSEHVRRRLAELVARLDRDGETDAVRWIESVSEFDLTDAPGHDEAR